MKQFTNHYEYIERKTSARGFKIPVVELRGVYKVESVNPLIYNDVPKITLVKACDSYFEACNIMKELVA